MVQPEEQAEEGLWLLSYQVGSRGCLQPAHVEKHICSVVDLWNELFRIRLRIFKSSGSGSSPCYLRIFGHYKKPYHQSKGRIYQLTAFSISHYCPESTGLNLKRNFNLSALSFLLDPEQIFPDPGKSSGSGFTTLHICTGCSNPIQGRPTQIWPVCFTFLKICF